MCSVIRERANLKFYHIPVLEKSVEDLDKIMLSVYHCLTVMRL